ncbi:MAG: O-antigen polymerase [Pseudomonadota bacterium]
MVDRRLNSVGCPPILFIVCAMFTYSSFGHAILYHFDFPIFSGIRTDYIPEALALSIVALAALVFAGAIVLLNLSRKTHISELSASLSSKTHNKAVSTYLLIAVSLVLFAVSVNILAVFAFTGFWDLPKLTKLAYVGPNHYILLLMWMVSFVVCLAQSWRLNAYIIASFLFFSFYCLLMSERDFVFAGLAMALVALKGRAISGTSMVVLPAVFLVLVTLLSGGRGGNFDSSFWISSLSQGSNLFVNTYVIEFIDSGGDMRLGETLLSSIVSTATFGFFEGSGSLSNWLVNSYARGSNSGYGFSLEAEGYLNFGYFGVFVAFFLIGYIVTWAAASTSSDRLMPRLVYVWGTTFLLYQLRQESLTVIKTLWLCIFVAGVVGVLAILLRPVLKRPSNHRRSSAFVEI